MRKFHYNEPIFDHNNDIIDNRVLTISEQQILDRYWPYWYNRMVRKYGPDHHLITEQNCIDDWVIVNWAWPVEDSNVSQKHDSSNSTSFS